MDLSKSRVYWVLVLADHQYINIHRQIRYAIDDMYMIPILQLQAYRVAGEQKYLNLAAETMADYLKTLQQSDGEIQDTSNWAYKPDSHPEVGNRYVGDEENYYFERARLTGNNHGQAPMLWCALTLIQ